MPMIASPTAADDHLAARPLHDLGGGGVGAVLLRGRRPGGGVHGADADHDVDDRLARRGDPLADLGEALLVAVAEERLEPLPEGQQEHPDRDRPDQDLPERLLGELLHGALGVGGALPVAEGQLDGQPGDDQVDDPVGDQADPRGAVDPLALVCLPPRLLGRVLMLLMSCLPLPRSRYPEGAASCGQERSASALSMARWKVG